MQPILAPLPVQATSSGLRRFTVLEYHRMIEIGMLTEDENLELLDGYLVHKFARNPLHESTLQLASEALAEALPKGWRLRIQSAVTLPESEPEPDIAVVRGDTRTYHSRHPGPPDTGALIEISDTTLAADRLDKCRIYAHAKISCFWIVNLVNRQIEVYTQPSGPLASPAYGHQDIYRPGDAIPLVLDGVTIAIIAVNDILP